MELNRAVWFLASLLTIFLVAPTPGAQAPTKLPAPLTPPGLPTPVGYLRQLLAANPAEREQLLSSKPDVERARWIDLVEKYQALPESERSDKLRATEFYFLMKKSPGELFAAQPVAALK